MNRQQIDAIRVADETDAFGELLKMLNVMLYEEFCAAECQSDMEKVAWKRKLLDDFETMIQTVINDLRGRQQ